MKRAVCIWLPNWPLQRLAAARAELSDRAIVLYELHSSGGAKVVAYCPQLAAAGSVAAGNPTGIRPGMPLAEATALWAHASSHSSGLHLEPVDPAADRLAMGELAEWCRQFSPTVGLEEAAAPESLLLDATGLAPLFGGEQAFAGHIVRAFQNRGLVAHVAVADTLGVAWAVAHFGPSEVSLDHESGCHAHAGVSMPERKGVVPLIIPAGGSFAALASLPPAALRLPEETCALLVELGLRRIEQLTALPRETLLARFGPLVLARLDQAHGAALEAIAGRPLPPEWSFEWLFEHPTHRGEAIRAAVDHLVEQACAALARTRQGMLRIACRFDPEHGPPTQRIVGFYRPSAAARHVGEVVHLKLEGLSFREPLAAIRLNVLAFDRLEFRQQEFFAPECSREAPRELATLVDRLSNRLGSHAVLRPWLLADAQPEFACQYQPILLPCPLRERAGARGKKKKKTTRKPRGATHMSSQENLQTARADSQTNSRNSPLTSDPSSTRDEGSWIGSSPRGEEGDRPLWLERVPRRLTVLAVAPEGPPVKFQFAGHDQRIVRAWGPERIETGWWRGGCVRRDYYQVETTGGQRYWLFRELPTGRWFLHGEFT